MNIFISALCTRSYPGRGDSREFEALVENFVLGLFFFQFS